MRCGRRHEADQALTHFERDAARTGRLGALAGAARCRALMTDDLATMESEARTAIRLFNTLGARFELGRALLVRAEQRRALGHDGWSDDGLESLAIFESMGAKAWVVQAAGMTGPAHDQPSELSGLTEAERRVAIAVARGLANREIAGELFVSLKTVEFHLGNVYRKLGLRSRTELVAQLARR